MLFSIKSSITSSFIVNLLKTFYLFKITNIFKTLLFDRQKLMFHRDSHISEGCTIVVKHSHCPIYLYRVNTAPCGQKLKPQQALIGAYWGKKHTASCSLYTNIQWSRHVIQKS